MWGSVQFFQFYDTFVGGRAILNELDILRRVPRNATRALG